MDVSMPFMGGMEATELIRSYEMHRGLSPTPIIALTAHASAYISLFLTLQLIPPFLSSDWWPWAVFKSRHGMLLLRMFYSPFLMTYQQDDHITSTFRVHCGLHCCNTHHCCRTPAVRGSSQRNQQARWRARFGKTSPATPSSGYHSKI
jgi:hypothetical protein